jgi:hypothetical protein
MEDEKTRRYQYCKDDYEEQLEKGEAVAKG